MLSSSSISANADCRIIFYSTANSPRLTYIVNFIAHELTNTPFYITQSKTEYSNFEGIKINYSNAPIAGHEIWVQPKSLLFESTICQQQTECSIWQNLIIFFRTAGDIPFDIFAATFYLLSRYEEYLPYSKDAYNRFSHTNSLAFKNGFLDKPMINLWIKKLGELLQKKFPEFKPSELIFKFIPTYDIDIAYAYQHKSFIRTAGGLLTNFTKPKTLLERLRVLSGKQKDPFDIYDWLHQLHHKYQLKPIYFFLLASKNGLYDKNISPRNPKMQQLIFQHGEKYSIGVHPSWQSGKTVAKLREEIAALTKITGRPVQKSRQHYIQLQMPDTYRNLIQLGILDDYSMGYGSINGFRASCCSSFYWYNLLEDHSTNLRIHPFCFMEANSFFEQQYSAAAAATELQEYYNTIKMINGTLIAIFHNHFLTQQEPWLPWRTMYADFIDKNFS